MFSSTVIATIGRPSLARSVNSVLGQRFEADDFEIIVVNDSGDSLPPEDWQQSKRVRIIDTYRRERIVARDTGAAISRGRYLHFLDDDDWLLPGALQALYNLSRTSPAAWLYGATQLVDRADSPLITLDHQMQGNCFVQAMAGEWLPLQASLINSKTFFKVGGFRHDLLVTQDVDLFRRVSLHDDIAGVSQVVCCVQMGAEGSSTDYSAAPRMSRAARELILDEAGVWARLQSSAQAGEWKGRISRVYLTSMIWNLQCRRLFTALSRGCHGLASLATGTTTLLSSRFWSALTQPYESPTYARGFARVQGVRPSGSSSALEDKGYGSYDNFTVSEPSQRRT